jgi:transposase
MCKPAKCSLGFELRQKETQLEEANIKLAAQETEIKELKQELEKTRGLLRLSLDELYGSNNETDLFSSEKTDDEKEKPEDPSPDKEPDDPNKEPDDPNKKTKRGAKPGHKGHGRKIPEHLPMETKIHEVPEDQAVCPRCGKPYADSGLCEESHEIDIEIKVSVIKHKRKRKFRACNCSNLPVSVTAPTPPKVIPKCMYSHQFLAHFLSYKYGFQIPLNRIILMLAQVGLKVNAGTICGIFNKLCFILKSFYGLFKNILRKEEYLHADETRFNNFNTSGKMSFTEIESETNKRYWLWVFSGPNVIYFVVDPSRSSAVCEDTLGSNINATLMTDGFSAYSKYVKGTEINHALCWVHFRRFFKQAATSFPKLSTWAQQWIERIGHIYKLNHKRLESVGDSDLFNTAQSKLELAVNEFYDIMKKEVKDPTLHEKQFKILTSGIANWNLYTPFVDDYRIPMDNNEAERNLRPGTLGRKNWYGVHTEWSGIFTAMMMTFIQTATRHGLNSTAYLKYILDKYAEYAGNPRNLQELLPWNIPEKILQQYNMSTGGDPP